MSKINLALLNCSGIHGLSCLDLQNMRLIDFHTYQIGCSCWILNPASSVNCISGNVYIRESPASNVMIVLITTLWIGTSVGQLYRLTLSSSMRMRRFQQFQGICDVSFRPLLGAFDWAWPWQDMQQQSRQSHPSAFLRYISESHLLQSMEEVQVPRLSWKKRFAWMISSVRAELKPSKPSYARGKYIWAFAQNYICGNLRPLP